MADIKLTQEEADRMIRMLKRSLEEKFMLPPSGVKNNFRVIGDNKKEVFTIEIFSGNRNPRKRNFEACIFKSGIPLLELHITPNGKHRNPDGELIEGNHWHMYREGYDRAYAFPADDITSEDFIENTIAFLDRFNVIEKPAIMRNDELF